MTNDLQESFIQVTQAPLREGKWLGGRGARLTPAQKLSIKKRCLTRDGNRCMICNKDESDPWTNLEIDHIDGNAANHFDLNLRLAHHPCNSREWNRCLSKTQRPSDHSERERGVLAPRLLGLEPASVEVRLNVQYEPAFRRFCLQRVKTTTQEGKVVTLTELRISAREYAGCSGSTSYSYIERLFAPNGPLVQKHDTFADSYYVDFRLKEDRNLSVDELETKYPKTGTRNSIDASSK